MPRKKPFSGKQKRKQLQEKKIKRDGSSTRAHSNERWLSKQKKSDATSEDSTSSNDDIQIRKTSRKGVDASGRNENPRERYRLNFMKESRDEIEKRKRQAQTEILSHVSSEEMEMNIEEIYKPGSELDMPQRPSWNYGESKQMVERREEKYFAEYLNNIYKIFEDKQLSYFEHNLETWRQLWRVLEMSDVIAMVADVRHPVLHFSPALYNFVTEKMQKPLILILNKVDLVPAPAVVAWKRYFESKFPKLDVVTFTSFPKNVKGVASEKRIRKRRQQGKRVYSTQIGPQDLLKVCRRICEGKVDLESWDQKIKDDLENLTSDADVPAEYERSQGEHSKCSSDENFTEKTELFKDGKLTLGFVGHPNVGKSSLMNGLIGKKVVSTSVTPGHTKYFQTYFLTRTVMLCDCPGLVFPSLVEKQMQILSGIYPVAQVQEPYTPIGYLAARIPVVKLLGITHPEHENGASEKAQWTAWDVCEAWAEKRGFYTAKGRRTDVYRAANNILRMAVDGRLCMFMLPPNYTVNEKKWIHDPETAKLLNLTFDPQKLKDLLSFHDSFGEKELASTDDDSAKSSDNDSSSSNGHGDGTKKLAMCNKFALLVDED